MNLLLSRILILGHNKYNTFKQGLIPTLVSFYLTFNA